MSDEEKKSATATIASEAIRVLPEADKRMAGRNAGDALTNLAAAAADVTLWIRLAASVPRNAAGFVARAAQKWRALPAERRALPSPKLLLETAAGYAAVDDDELKARYERLLESALDVGTTARVHPAFPTMLGEMAGIEARLLDFIGTGGYFESYDQLIAALGVVVDARRIQIGLQNLARLGLISIVEGAILKASVEEQTLRRSLANLLGEIHIEEEVRMQIIGIGEAVDFSTRAKARVVYKVTPFGKDFGAVVGGATSVRPAARPR